MNVNERELVRDVRDLLIGKSDPSIPAVAFFDNDLARFAIFSTCSLEVVCSLRTAIRPEWISCWFTREKLGTYLLGARLIRSGITCPICRNVYGTPRGLSPKLDCELLHRATSLFMRLRWNLEGTESFSESLLEAHDPMRIEPASVVGQAVYELDRLLNSEPVRQSGKEGIEP